jgi:hypothetical protein
MKSFELQFTGLEVIRRYAPTVKPRDGGRVQDIARVP